MSYLKELHGKDKLIEIINKQDDENYSINLKTGKITKKRASKSVVPESTEPVENKPQE